METSLSHTLIFCEYIVLKWEKGKKKQKLDLMIISSIPVGECHRKPGERRHIPTCISRAMQLTPTILSELQLVFNIYSVCLSERIVTLGTPLNDRRIQMEHGRGVSGNRGTW